MAKRQRTRPGRRPPTSRSPRSASAPATTSPATTSPATSGPSGSLSAAEEARAAELEAQIVAEERAATATRDRGRERRRAEATGRTRDSAPIELRAEQEYAYVVRDVRRIVRVGGSLLIVLALLFVLIDVTGLIRL